MTERQLRPGSFYWVKPVFDVDFTPPGHAYGEPLFDVCYHHWTQMEQPARFDGYDAAGNEKWVYLGQEVDETNWWPACWVGDEISCTLKRA